MSLDFGDRVQGTSSVLSITLTNAGSAAIDVRSAEVQGPDATAFGIVGVVPQRLAAGESTPLQISFRPARAGAFAARLVLVSNAANTPELSLPLVATSNGSDAGLAGDAGQDAGVGDAGFDAGPGPDAGFDAGVPDAGPFDAGPFDAGAIDAGVDAGCSLLLCGRAASGVTCAVATAGNVGPFGGAWASNQFSNATGWQGAAYGRTVTFVDVDGDGRADACGRGVAGVDCAHNTGAGFDTLQVWTTEFSDALGWNTAPQYYATLQFADVNGDGRMDACGRSDAGVECAVSGVSVWRTASFTDATDWGQATYFPSVQFADVNGDGKADVCGRGLLGISCSVSSSVGLGPYTGWSTEFSDADGWASPSHFQTVQFADVNGDGKADVCGRGTAGVGCALSDGTRFLPASTWAAGFSDVAGWTQPAEYTTIQFPDLDGDGKADVCGRAAAGLVCGLSDGTRFTPLVTTQLFSDTTGWGASPAYYSTIQFADLDGDGQLDVCGRGLQGVACALRRQGTFGAMFSTQALASDAAGWADASTYPTLRFASGSANACRVGPRTPASRVGP